MASIVGTDFNGTYETHNELHGKVDFICTGTSWEDYADFMLLKEGPDVPIFFNPIPKKKVDELSTQMHKANIIKETGATKFYENNPATVKLLKVLCPDCTTILVKDGLEVTS